jgi:hypothetical protein
LLGNTVQTLVFKFYEASQIFIYKKILAVKANGRPTAQEASFLSLTITNGGNLHI